AGYDRGAGVSALEQPLTRVETEAAAELLGLSRVAAEAFRLQHRRDLLPEQASPFRISRIRRSDRGCPEQGPDQDSQDGKDRAARPPVESRLRHDTSTSWGGPSWGASSRDDDLAGKKLLRARNAREGIPAPTIPKRPLMNSGGD